MKFYHYTSIPLAEAIFDAGLSKGHLLTSTGEFIQPVVWLTTDPLPYGHGLLTGEEELNDRELAYLMRVQGTVPRNRFTHNKQQIRIEIDAARLIVPPVRYTQLCRSMGEAALWPKLMGLSCFHSFSELDK